MWKLSYSFGDTAENGRGKKWLPFSKKKEGRKVNVAKYIKLSTRY
jgi:hypothetical protein